MAYTEIEFNLHEAEISHVAKLYGDGWVWGGWNIVAPYTEDTEDGIRIHAEEDYHPLTFGALVGTVVIPGISNTGHRLYGIVPGQRYMFTVLNEFCSNKNNDSWSTCFVWNSGGQDPFIDDNRGYREHGQENGITYGLPNEHFGYLDTNITFDHGNHPMKIWSSPCPPVLYFNEGDITMYGWNWDNEGTIEVAAYEAFVDKLELGLRIPIQGVAVAGTFVAIHLHAWTSPNPFYDEFFLQVRYTDGTYRSATDKLTIDWYGPDDILFYIAYTIPPEDAGKHFDSIVVGQYFRLDWNIWQAGYVCHATFMRLDIEDLQPVPLTTKSRLVTWR